MANVTQSLLLTVTQSLSTNISGQLSTLVADSSLSVTDNIALAATQNSLLDATENIVSTVTQNVISSIATAFSSLASVAETDISSVTTGLSSGSGSGSGEGSGEEEDYDEEDEGPPTPMPAHKFVRKKVAFVTNAIYALLGLVGNCFLVHTFRRPGFKAVAYYYIKYFGICNILSFIFKLIKFIVSTHLLLTDEDIADVLEGILDIYYLLFVCWANYLIVFFTLDRILALQASGFSEKMQKKKVLRIINFICFLMAFGIQFPDLQDKVRLALYFGYVDTDILDYYNMIEAIGFIILTEFLILLLTILYAVFLSKAEVKDEDDARLYRMIMVTCIIFILFNIPYMAFRLTEVMFYNEQLEKPDNNLRAASLITHQAVYCFPFYSYLIFCKGYRERFKALFSKDGKVNPSVNANSNANNDIHTAEKGEEKKE